MIYEYLTVVFSEKYEPLTFKFASGAKKTTANLQEFLNQLGAKGWELMVAVPLAWQSENSGAQEITLCRLIFKKIKG